MIDIEAVRAGVDIVKIIGERIPLRKRGSSFKGLCPFHGERTPSFSVDPVKGRYHCFGCNAGGDAIDFLMRLDGLSFHSAVKAIGGESVVTPRRESPTLPVVDTRPFLAALWEIVSDAPWNTRAVEYLLSRHVEPDATWVLGCRDWSSRIRKVEDLVAGTAVNVLEAAGFIRSGKLWAPLDRLGDIEWAGIGVPVWRMGEAFPWRWRWRFLQPPYSEAPKSMSCFAAGSPTDLLGAGKALRVDGVGIADYGAPDVRAAHLGSGVDGAKTLLIVEGEPDWWSATEAADGRAIVVAVCGAPTSWRSVWPTLQAFHAHGVERVVVCVHEGAALVDGLGHGVRFAEDLASHAQRAGLAVRARLPSEGRDLNDLHCDGELRAWLDEVLAHRDEVLA